MPENQTAIEKSLLLQVARGDEKAFADLFYLYHTRLSEFILLVTRSREQTEEILQDVFVKVWLKRSTLGSVDNFGGWVYTIARNQTMNYLRSINLLKRNMEGYRNWAAGEGRAVAEPGDDGQYLSLLKRAVAQLPPRQREVFVLSREEGLSHQQICERLDMAYASVKKNIVLANRSITAFLKAHAEVSAILLLAGCFGR